MKIEEVVRGLQDRIDSNDCVVHVDTMSEWLIAIETAMRERDAPPKFHYEMPETQAVRLLQVDVQELKAKLTVAREVLRGLHGKGARLNRIEDAERILNSLAGNK